LKRWVELGAAVTLSALAFALYARVGWPWIILGTVWLVPWLAVLDRAVSLRDALIAGLVMAVAFVLLGFGWFAPAIVDYSGAPLAGALLLLAVAAPLLEPQLLAFAVARHLARRRSSDRAAAFVAACVYVASEWIGPKFFGDTLGQGLYASVWLRQGADLAGVHGLTLVLLLVNECLLASVYALMQLRRGAGGARDVLRPSAAAALLLLMLAAYGALRVRQLAPSDEPRQQEHEDEHDGGSENEIHGSGQNRQVMPQHRNRRLAIVEGYSMGPPCRRARCRRDGRDTRTRSGRSTSRDSRLRTPSRAAPKSPPSRARSCGAISFRLSFPSVRP